MPPNKLAFPWHSDCFSLGESTEVMRAVAIERRLSTPEVGSYARARPSKAVANPLRSLWFRFRRLMAELVAFPVHLHRTDEKLVFSAYLPGLQREEVIVEVGDLGLIIEVDPKRLDMGPYWKAGRRLVSLPDGIDFKQVKAELRNGVLTVSLPLSESRRHRHVPVECDESPVPIQSP
jgi:HSP20 family molecular chaperone IbpA